MDPNQQKSTLAATVIKKIQKLYRIGREAKHFSGDQRLQGLPIQISALVRRAATLTVDGANSSTSLYSLVENTKEGARALCLSGNGINRLTCSKGGGGHRASVSV